MQAMFQMIHTIVSKKKKKHQFGRLDYYAMVYTLYIFYNKKSKV